ncbi:MAG TPA: AmmeMemoRadiSam system protein A [Verrucomicrobiae bacterium]|nr:AmmeMemoRadiSam system protein A [Verrucomicrobiae bacterium]
MRCLSETDRKSILELARQAVEEAVRHGRLLMEIPCAGIFNERCGVFVTLTVGGKLRGCIGVIEGKAVLGESIVQCATESALEDPRFSPMQPEELPRLEIEVSLLSPLERIKAEQVEIGKHGLLVEQGYRRGLLLPQVAVEHHFDREQFLRETCYKAGLPTDAWKIPETRIYGFSCEIVTEAK